jgi:hypothetical protein
MSAKKNFFDGKLKKKPAKSLKSYPFKGQTTELRQINLKKNGIPLYQKYLVPTGKASVTRKEALIVSNAVRQVLKDKYGKDHVVQLGVSVNDTKQGWRRSYVQDIDQNVQLWSHQYYDMIVNGKEFDDIADKSEDHFSALSFYVYVTKKQAGTSDYNDCVYNCIKDIDGQPFKDAVDFKNKIRIHRMAKVSLNDIPKIEELMKDYKINITGDMTYFSSKVAPKTINLIFSGEHAVLENPHIRNLITPDQDKKIYFYYQDGPDRFILYKNATTEVEIKTNNEIMLKLFKQASKGVNKSDNIILKCLPKKLTEEEKELSAREQSILLYENCKIEHERLLKDATKLKEMTNGKINLFKTCTYKKTALKLFYETIQHIIPDSILRDEAHFIRMSTMGSLMYCKKGYKGDVHYQDFKSFYPSLMKRQQAKYPIKRGEFTTLTNEEFDNMKFFKFGIYRAIVTGDHELFRFNNGINYYTHTDLQLAKELKLKIELIEDGQANFLYYSSDKLMQGKDLFGEFVNTLYPLRKHAKLAKDILNILWGSLGELNNVQKELDMRIEHNLPPSAIIEEIYPRDDNVLVVRYIEPDQPIFKTDFARMVTFLLAYGRRDMIQLIQPFIDDVVYVRTDGFRTKTKQDLKFGDDIGQLFYEGKENIEIKNINHVIKY